jgi:hypothetical protein
MSGCAKRAMILVILGSRAIQGESWRVARKPRVEFEDGFYHVIARGTQRREVPPGTHDRLYLPAVPDNNSFQDCSILDSNSWPVSAS